MEKFIFDRKIQQAILRRRVGQLPTVVINGDEKKVRGPAFTGAGTRDFPCLVEKERETGNAVYNVVAFSFDKADKKEKDWICTQPILLEKAIGFFIENHQMESISRACKCASRLADTRDSGFDIETEDVEIEIKVPLFVPKNGTMWKGFSQAVKQMISYCNSSCAKDKGKRVVLLIICQQGTGHIQSMTNRSLKEELLKKAVDMGIEFWMAETKTEEDGISLISYQNFTDDLIKD